MKKVFSSISQCIHVWAQQTQQEGKAGNVFFDGPTLYSYRLDYPIAKFITNKKDEKAVLFRPDRYSSSTSQHEAAARQAVGLTERFSIPQNRWGETDLHFLRKYFIEKRDAALLKASRARTNWGYIGDAEHHVDMFNRYAAFIGSRLRTSMPDDTSEAMTTLKQRVKEQMVKNKLLKEERERKYAEQRAELLKHAAKAVATWEADTSVGTGVGMVGGLHHAPCAVRLKGDVIQTSHGAEVPASVAPRLWQLVTACRDAGTMYDAPIHVGAFTLRWVDPVGNVQIGCHHIGYDALQRLAVKMGFVQ